MIASGRAVMAGAGIVAGLAAAAGVLHARETRYPQAPSTERLLYLRSGKVADRLFLSFDAVGADIYWIRTIQHYGRDRKSARTTDRFALLQPLVDLTTTLDPSFNIAYRFGAIFLAMEPPNGPGRPDQAIALLEKGLARNANRWQYAHDIAFIHYFYNADYTAAARWFEKAAAMPGAPEWIRPLIPITLAQGGDRQGARQMLTELLGSEQGYIRQAAERGLMQIRALDAIDQLQSMVDQYTTATGRPPQDWSDLIRAGALPGVPLDDRQKPFVIDPVTHTVALSPQSELNPLPKALGRK
jgi:tetratricopeptide (TPR) repeat protein